MFVNVKENHSPAIELDLDFLFACLEVFAYELVACLSSIFIESGVFFSSRELLNFIFESLKPITTEPKKVFYAILFDFPK